MPIIGATVTDAALTLGHEIAFSITLAMLTGMLIYTAYTAKRRFGYGRWHRWGPTVLVAISFVLIMMDPVRHVLYDWGVWTDPSSWEYRLHCNSGLIDCMTVTGVFFTIIATYAGFTCLIVGSLWNGNIIQRCSELRAKWRDLRSAQTTTEEPAATAAAPAGAAAAPATAV